MPSNPPNRSGFTAPIPMGSLPVDCGYAAWTYDPVAAATTSLLQTAGRLTLSKLYLPGPTPINNIFQMMSVAGATLTANQNFVCVYDQARQLIAQTAPGTMDGLWVGSAGLLTCPVATNLGLPNLIDTPIGWIACYYNGTTAPTLRSCAPANVQNTNGPLVAAQARASLADTGLTTAPPSPQFAQPSSLSVAYFWGAIN